MNFCDIEWKIMMFWQMFENLSWRLIYAPSPLACHPRRWELVLVTNSNVPVKNLRQDDRSMIRLLLQLEAKNISQYWPLASIWLWWFSGFDKGLCDDLCRRSGLLQSLKLHALQDKCRKCSSFHYAFVTGGYSYDHHDFHGIDQMIV